MQKVEEIETLITTKPAVMIYFSAPTCNVCHALKPKLLEAIDENFPAVEIVSIDTSVEQKLAAYFNVFAIPTVLVYLDGKEFLRKSRHMSVGDVTESIRRPYNMMMS